jgi:hypothetical protein
MRARVRTRVHALSVCVKDGAVGCRWCCCFHTDSNTPTVWALGVESAVRCYQRRQKRFVLSGFSEFQVYDQLCKRSPQDIQHDGRFGGRRARRADGARHRGSDR